MIKKKTPQALEICVYILASIATSLLDEIVHKNSDWADENNVLVTKIRVNCTHRTTTWQARANWSNNF